MGYFGTALTDDLHLPSNPDCIVVMRRKAPFGADLAMQDAMVTLTTDDISRLSKENGNGNGHASAPSKVDVAASTRAMLLALIVSWNLTDEKGQIAPINSETIDQLEPEDGRFLAGEAQKRIAARRTEEQRRPFGNKSSSPSASSPARGSRRHGA